MSIPDTREPVFTRCALAMIRARIRNTRARDSFSGAFSSCFDISPFVLVCIPSIIKTYKSRHLRLIKLDYAQKYV
jgi:hypothetical protein